MKSILSSLIVAAAVSYCAADDPKAEVKAAAEKLANSPSYSWAATPKSNEGTSPVGSTEGKTEKDGYTYFALNFSNNTVEGAFKGDKSVINIDGYWESSDDLTGDREWIQSRMKSYKTPAKEVLSLLDKTRNLKKDSDGSYSGELQPEAVKDLVAFRNADVSDATGKIRFWVRDGLLSKYEWTARGTISFQGQSRDFDRSTTVDIKEVGKTKVTVPDGAKSKLN